MERVGRSGISGTILASAAVGRSARSEGRIDATEGRLVGRIRPLKIVVSGGGSVGEGSHGRTVGRVSRVRGRVRAGCTQSDRGHAWIHRQEPKEKSSRSARRASSGATSHRWVGRSASSEGIQSVSVSRSGSVGRAVPGRAGPRRALGAGRSVGALRPKIADSREVGSVGR